MQNLRVLVITMAVVLLAGCTLARYLPDYDRSKRSGSDQRIAELQALIALGGGGGGLVGHGYIDPISDGKRKRSDDLRISEDFENVHRLRLLQKVLTALTDDSS